MSGVGICPSLVLDGLSWKLLLHSQKVNCKFKLHHLLFTLCPLLCFWKYFQQSSFFMPNHTADLLPISINNGIRYQVLFCNCPAFITSAGWHKVWFASQLFWKLSFTFMENLTLSIKNTVNQHYCADNEVVVLTYITLLKCLSMLNFLKAL